MLYSTLEVFHDHFGFLFDVVRMQAHEPSSAATTVR